MKITMIAALAKNNVVGKDNQMPWHLPADLKHFKQCTMGKPIIMGRKTYESIGKPLPGRLNIVLTRDTQFTAPGCELVHSPNDALALAAPEHEEIIIMGGPSIYELFMPQADRMILTFIDADCEGDAFFPTWNAAEWQEVSRESHQADEKNAYAYSFVEFLRA